MEKRQHRQKEVLMTEGPIWRCLLLFALPLMAGNLFQQLYNTVDSIVVGNFVGKEALAAVGSTDSVINTFIGFFSGMSTGAGVIISQYYGGKKEEKVSVAVQTTIALTLCMSILCTVLALLLVPSLLRLMGTPEDVFPEAATYLRIYFIGVTGLLFYNMGAGILRAVGDSRRPLYFLIFCAVLNTLLDLLFVAVLRFGIAGAAWATILSQGISALLTLFVLTREKACYRIIWSKVRLDPGMTKKIFFLGLPAAIQMAVTSFSNVFVQAYINRFGSAAMAGWSSYGKIDKFCVLPIQSLSLGVTTFVGQNLGARKIDRVRQSTKVGTLLCFAVAILITIPVLIFARPLVSMFNRTPEVLDYQSGTRRHTAGYRQYKSPHGHHDELLYRVPPDLSLHGHTVYRLCHRRRTRLSAGLAIVQHPSVYLLPSHEAGNVSAVKTAPDASVFAMASGVSRFPFFSHITNTFINAPP